jgi:hypothetical protein
MVSGTSGASTGWDEVAMVAIEETVEVLRKDLNDILKKYPISPEERSFIIEKVEETIGSIVKIQHGTFSEKLSEIRHEIGSEREAIRTRVENLKRAAVEKINEVNGKIGQAYEKGISERAAVTNEPSESVGPSTLNVILAIFFAALAFVVIASSIFSGGEKDKKKG